jgi:hypothetical protein
MAANRWISMFGDMFISIMIFSVSILAILSKHYNIIILTLNNNNNAALIAFAITNIFKITWIFSLTIKLLTELIL